MTTTSAQTSSNYQPGLWMAILLASIRSDRPDLTNRQMALLMTVYLRPPPHTIRGLAACLQLSKPVVSRAVQNLEAVGFLHRQKDHKDRRNVYIERSSTGAAFLIEFFDMAQPPLRSVERRPRKPVQSYRRVPSIIEITAR